MFLPHELTDSAITAFAQSLTGELVRPGDAAYNGLRAVFNRVGSPAFIVRCASEQDVARVVQFAQSYDFPLSIRSGGHGLTGAATNDGGVVIDLSRLSKITVINQAEQLVRIETGATWGAVAEALGHHELAVTSGDTSTVGVGGLIVGGGIGWMVRKYGLTIDSLVSATVVTASGEILHVDQQHHPDLFWAIRGGGGNFGVVTAVEIKAQPVTNVVFGSIYFDASADARSILKQWADLASTAPNELTTHLSVVPQSLTRNAAFALTLCYAGDDTEAAMKVIDPLSQLGPVIQHDLRVVPYASVLPNRGHAHFSDFKAVHRTQFMETLSDEAINVIATEFTKPGAPVLQLRILGGAVERVKPEETAFAFRGCRVLAVAMQGVDASNPEKSELALRSAWKHLEPFAAGKYVNFLSATDDAAARSAYPPETYRRLVAVKAQYDPTNLFRSNVNINPAHKPAV